MKTGEKVALSIGIAGVAATAIVVREASNCRTISTRILAEATIPPDFIVTGAPVSVIIPTYKEQTYIEDTLHAIHNQTYSPIEIVISDASDQESEYATRAVTDKYGAVFVHTDIKNISLGRNLGADAASSDILIFLDADCIMAKDFTERLVYGLSQPGVHLAHGVDVFHLDRPEQDLRHLKIKLAARMVWSRTKPETYTTGRGVAIRAADFWDIAGYDETIDPMKPRSREDLDIGGKVFKKWGKGSIWLDRHAYVSEPTRRPTSAPGLAAWQQRGWRNGEPID